MPVSLETAPTPLLEELMRPISGDAPAGEDVSYDDDFLFLKGEIDQMSAASTTGVDYGVIVDKSRDLLGRKAKDLRISSYLGFALARTEGFRGLLEGLVAQKVLVDAFWKEMHPPIRRMPARRNALQFLAERLTEAVEQAAPGVADREPIEESLEVLKDLQEFLMSTMEDQAPLMSGLKRALEEALRRAPKPAAPPPPPPPPPEPAAEGQPRIPAPPPTAHAAPAPMAAGEPASEDDAAELVRLAAVYFQVSDPASPISYRLRRGMMWGMLPGEPMHDGGALFFDGPAEHRRTYLNGLVQGGDWTTLLQEAEAVFQEPPLHFWLDLQRWIATAMERLGAEYDRAREGVLLETALLVRRIPGLVSLSFADRTPLADSATKEWLEEAVLPMLEGGGAPSGASRKSDPLAGQYEEAQRLQNQGELGAALGVLQQGAAQDGSPRTRFRRRLYMATLCLRGGQANIAGPLLEDLSRDVERLGLHEWEPELAVEVWRSLYQCYQAQLMDPTAFEDASLRERSQRVFQQLCRVDVTQALAANAAA